MNDRTTHWYCARPGCFGLRRVQRGEARPRHIVVSLQSSSGSLRRGPARRRAAPWHPVDVSSSNDESRRASCRRRARRSFSTRPSTTRSTSAGRDRIQPHRRPRTRSIILRRRLDRPGVIQQASGSGPLGMRRSALSVRTLRTWQRRFFLRAVSMAELISSCSAHTAAKVDVVAPSSSLRIR